MGYTQDVRRAYHARGALFAVLGIVLVFGGTVLVNQLTEAPDAEAEQRSRPVDLVRKAPPPPKPKPRAQQPRPPRVARTAPPPPLAALAARPLKIQGRLVDREKNHTTAGGTGIC